jgi:hypothetical protein
MTDLACPEAIEREACTDTPVRRADVLLPSRAMCSCPYCRALRPARPPLPLAGNEASLMERNALYAKEFITERHTAIIDHLDKPETPVPLDPMHT